MITDAQAAELIATALQIPPLSVLRQPVTHSGNAIFRALFPDDQSVVLRVSPRPGAFTYTRRHLAVLRKLGLPVQSVLALGLVPPAGSFIILNWIPGRDLIYELPHLRPDQATLIAQTVTDYQRRVGALPEGAGFGRAPLGQTAAAARWTDLFGAPVTTPIPADAPPLERFRARLRTVRKSLEPYFATVHPTCFLDDLTTKNVLVADGSLQGIIDVDLVSYGDPLMTVGATLAHLAADLGPAGDHYGHELIHCSNPSPVQLRALRFYTALWTIGFLSAAETAGDPARATVLTPIADSTLRAAETV